MPKIDLLFHNPPAVLLPLAKEWHDEGRSFYLGPENLFWYGESKVHYKASKDVSREPFSWRICTSDCLQPTYNLTEQDITAITGVFAARLEFETCLNYVGSACNSRCKMCPYHGPDNKENFWGQFPSWKRVLDLDEMKARVDIVASLGIGRIACESIGDLFAYKHWREYVAYSSLKGLKPLFNTNGTMLTDDACRFIADHGVEMVLVSLNAATPETHSRITGITRPGAFETAENGILLLHNKYNVNVVAKTVWCHENAHEVSEFIEKWTRRGIKTQCIFLHNDFSADTKNHYSMPVGMCEESYCTRLYVMPDGRMAPCGGSLLFMNRENSFGLPEWYIDDGNAKENLAEMRRSFFTNPVWKEVCSRCKLASPIQYGEEESNQQHTRWWVDFEPSVLPLSKKVKNLTRAVTPPFLHKGVRTALGKIRNQIRKKRGKYREF